MHFTPPIINLVIYLCSASLVSYATHLQIRNIVWISSVKALRSSTRQEDLHSERRRSRRRNQI